MSLEESRELAGFIRQTIALRIESIRKLNEAVPLLQEQLRFAEWEEETLGSAPDSFTPSPAILPQLRRQATYIAQSLPLIPDYSTARPLTATAFITSGTASTFATVWDGQGSDDCATRDWASTRACAYLSLHESMNMESRVRSAVETSCRHETLARFDRAAATAKSASAGITSVTAAALEMRTLVDGVKGDVFSRANAARKSWVNAANSLFAGDAASEQRNELVGLGNVHRALIDELSPVAKDRRTLEPASLSALWTRVVDWVFAVLTLVDGSEGRHA